MCRQYSAKSEAMMKYEVQAEKQLSLGPKLRWPSEETYPVEQRSKTSIYGS